MNRPSPISRKRARVGIVIAVGVVLGICILRAVSSQTGFTPYSRFINRDSGYYSNVVEACDLLLQSAPVDVEYERVFDGTNAALPHIIWDLRPTKVEVLSRCKLVGDTRLLTLVRIYMGESRGGYSIVCLATEHESFWQLEAAWEGGSKVLLTTKKLPRAKAPTLPPGGSH
jgi:hypothetical protein